ncbi:HPr family phosphocarrier protein, partial [Chromobacterium piscinae]|uniref:HPr family phosphocarrier protein n=1 Tax=Chromobacterium piscinae TaxID=686831 RepID=UPI003260EEFA
MACTPAPPRCGWRPRAYPNGLHARPAALWVEAARRSPAQLQVRHGGRVADAKNLISLLQLGLRQGDLVAVSARG